MKYQVLVLASIFLISCQSSNHENPSVRTVQLSTVLPQTASGFNPTTKINKLRFETDLLPTYLVSRSRAELREGPGIQFPLYDKILQKGSRLILIESLGIWRKIWAIDQNLQGWVHYQTLKSRKFKAANIALDFEAIPKVFAIRPIEKIYDFNSKKPLRWRVNQGRSFPAINKKGKMVLVYLPETNSLAWLQQRDVQ